MQESLNSLLLQQFADSGLRRFRLHTVGVGAHHTVLIWSAGSAVACGYNGFRKCILLELDGMLTYVQAAAGGSHTVLVRSDGSSLQFSNMGGERLLSTLRRRRLTASQACERFLVSMPLVVALISVLLSMQSGHPGSDGCGSSQPGATRENQHGPSGGERSWTT